MPASRLEAGEAEIVRLLTGIAGLAWARTAIRYCAPQSRSFCCRWPFAARASAPI